MEQIIVEIGMAALAVLALIVVWKIFSAPIKAILKFCLHIVLGLAVLLLVNFVGGFWNLYIPLNWVTVLISGLAGIPGVLLLILYTLLF